MVDNSVDQRVRSILAELFDLDLQDIGSQTSIETVPEWNSLQHLSLILSLEDEFGIEIDDAEAAEIDSYARIVSWVRSHVGESDGIATD